MAIGRHIVLALTFRASASSLRVNVAGSIGPMTVSSFLVFIHSLLAPAPKPGRANARARRGAWLLLLSVSVEQPTCIGEVTDRSL